MVTGLEHFVQFFRGLQDCFILIGGTACDLWFTDKGLAFRATKDLDIVLVAEATRPDFFQRFWEFIRDGAYESHQQNNPPPNYYRFKKPANPLHPSMIELFTRNILEVPGDVRLTPIPAGDRLSSLSAILIDDEYYQFIVDSRITINGVPTVPVQCLIPLKARAYLNLLESQSKGEQIDAGQIKKHRNDVFRLYLTLAPDNRFPLPAKLKYDVDEFLGRFVSDSPDWPNIQQAVDGLPARQSVIAQIRENFGLDSKNV